MITEEMAMAALTTLAVAGLKPPDIHAMPANRAEGTPSGRILAARVYAAALNHAGMLPAELEQSVVDYIAEPQEGQYPKCFPSPGHLVARSPIGRLIATLGTDADADRAWTDFGARCLHLLGKGRVPVGPFDLPTALDQDPHRHAAMWAGLTVIGGWDAWRMSDVSDRSIPARFRAAYIAERQRQRVDPAAVRGILTTTARLMIEAA